MAYSSTQKTNVTEAIQTYTNQYLERFTQADLINEANKALDANKTAIEVADAVYDYAYAHNSDNIVFATALQQCMPKDVLLILRNEIIKILE